MKIDSSNISPEVIAQLKAYVYDIIGCCQEVHQELGPWLNEYMYHMRLTNTPIGILYNFAPVKDQCEKYYYDMKTKTIAAF